MFNLVVFYFYFGCFLFLFLLEIENGNENIFDWISVFIFSENIFPNEPKIENNKISFSIKIRNLILGKMKTP